MTNQFLKLGKILNHAEQKQIKGGVYHEEVYCDVEQYGVEMCCSINRQYCY